MTRTLCRLIVQTVLLGICAPTLAANWNVHCTQMQADGVDHTAQCSGNISVLYVDVGTSDDLWLNTGYHVARNQDEEYVNYKLQVHRVEMPSDSEAILTVTGLRVERVLLPSDQKAFTQGPATGSCQVIALDRPQPQFICTVQTTDPDISHLHFDMTVDAASTSQQYGRYAQVVVKQLREARFALAVAEQAGRLTKLVPTSRPFETQAVIATPPREISNTPVDYARINVEAERGDAESQFQLCEYLQLPDQEACQAAGQPADVMRCQAQARPRNPAGAAHQCQAAADQGHPKATARLSDFYASGFGVPKDPKRARQLLWQAAERGDKGTLLNLARAYETGLPDSPVGPIERDIGKAIETYRRIGNERKIAELRAAQSQVDTSTDVTVYGIGVGFALPNLSQCDIANAAIDDRLCLDADSGRLMRFFDRAGLGRQAFTENGLRLLSVKVNDQKMDTQLLFALLGQSAPLEVAIDRNRTVHYVSAQTRITSGDAVLQMLTQKYGQPTRTDMTEWKDTHTGALVRRTPIYRWELRGLQVEFHAQHASTLGQMETPMGRIDIYTPTFAQLLARFAAQHDAQQPHGRF